jgi:hypothetical protein
VREMVHAHKGTVTAESSGEGLGSVFTVRLPLLPAVQVSVPEIVQAIGQPETDLTALRPDVLIVDDERDALEILALMLGTRGATVRIVWLRGRSPRRDRRTAPGRSIGGSRHGRRGRILAHRASASQREAHNSRASPR